MTPADRFAIIISAISVIFVILTTMLGLLIRAVVKWTRTEDKLNEVVVDVNRLAENSDIRLRWLEENCWGSRPAGRRAKMGNRPGDQVGG